MSLQPSFTDIVLGSKSQDIGKNIAIINNDLYGKPYQPSKFKIFVIIVAALFLGGIFGIISYYISNDISSVNIIKRSSITVLFAILGFVIGFFITSILFMF